jgi:signal transduction histidine kinase
VSSPLEALRARYLEWANGLDAEWSRTVRWPWGWALSGLVFAGLLTAAATVSPAREFFGLRLAPALLLEALALSALLGADQLELRGAFGPASRAAATLAVAFVLQVFGTGVVALSSPPGSFVLAAFPIMNTWYHLGAIRSGPRHPFGTAAHGAGLLAVAAVSHDPAHLGAYAAIALLGIGGGTLLGMLSTWAARTERAVEDHRAALSAQSLAAFASELEEVEATLADTAESEAATQEAVERALRACAELAAACDAHGADATVRQSVRRTADALQRGARLLAPVPAPAPPRAADVAAVDVLAVARAAVADASRRWPRLSFSCTPVGPGADGARAEVSGGVEGLRGVLDALVANACEGDGEYGASRVDVRVGRDGASGEVAIEVIDDGPGFPADVLARPIALLGTTKRSGPGLGLYTAERRVRGSLGSLARENRPEGGARVRVRLPAAGPRPRTPALGARP